jgi:uncharacterized membrane protein YccF (DUF307 family)
LVEEVDKLNCFGNLIWLIFGGFLSGMGYIIGGVLVCLTIVGIPFGVQSIKLGVATMAPFGREIVEREEPDSTLQVIFNMLWAIFFGWEIAVSHLIHAAILAITIIGIPFAKEHIKLIPLALLPFGKELK